MDKINDASISKKSKAYIKNRANYPISEEEYFRVNQQLETVMVDNDLIKRIKLNGFISASGEII